MLNAVEKASRISEIIEANITDLIMKLCEGETRDVRGMVWSMVAQRMAMLSGHGDCFQLPPVEEC